MDKTNSFRCIKYSLVAGNAAVVLFGLSGFILGLIDPPFLQMYDPYSDNLFPIDYGPSLALVSCIAVVIAAAGLIGAIREHFYLLILYCLCIIGVFIFRLAWWATSQLHQDKRFILDLTVSLTLLTFLAKLFLFILAILEAMTIQNSIPFTKKKFLMLRSKLINRSRKDSSEKEKPRKSGKKALPPDNNLYTTSSSLYGSGRRQSPVRPHSNGHGQSHGHHQQHHTGSQRSRKYLPSPVYSLESPNASSGSSHDSNNNAKNITGTTATLQNDSLRTKSNNSPLVIDITDHQQNAQQHQQQQQHRVPKNLSHEHYFRYQSPSPSATQLTSAKDIYSSRTNNQSVLNYKSSSHHRTASPQTEGQSIWSTPSSKTNSLPPVSRTQTPTSMTARSSPLYSSSTTLLTTTTKSYTSSGQSRSTYTTSTSSSLPRTNILTSSLPRTNILTSSYSSSKPESFLTSPPLSTMAKNRTTTTTTTTPSQQYNRENLQSQRANFFTSPPTPYSSANLFNYSSMRSSSPAATTTSRPTATSVTSTTPSNLNLNRNLFSTYTSPLNSNSGSTTAVPSSYTVTSPPTYRSSLPSNTNSSHTITSPSPTPRVSKSPYTPLASSSSYPPAPISSTPSYMQKSAPPQTKTASGGSSVFQTLFSPSQKSTAQPATTASLRTSSSSNLFGRSRDSSSRGSNAAKAYEDQYLNYIKSYRYPSSGAAPISSPTEYSTVRASATSSPSLVSPISMRISQYPQPISDRTVESYNMTRSGSMGANLESTTTFRTTEHREMRQESVYYKEVVREGWEKDEWVSDQTGQTHRETTNSQIVRNTWVICTHIAKCHCAHPFGHAHSLRIANLSRYLDTFISSFFKQSIQSYFNFSINTHTY